VRAPAAPEEDNVQGTIKDFDDAGRTGLLVTDDRTEVAIDERSLGDAFIHTLRIGQRVRFEVERTDEGGAVARDLHLVTF
jgi:cold shock CspA family protein